MDSAEVQMEWTISEARLRNMKPYEPLGTEYYSCSIPNVKYAIFVASYDKILDDNNQVGIAVRLEKDKGMVILADYSFIMGNSEQERKMHHTFIKCYGNGYMFAIRDDLFNSDKKFIVDGKLIIKFKATFKCDTVDTKFNAKESLWNYFWTKDDKDFDFIVDNKRIKVWQSCLKIFLFCTLSGSQSCLRSSVRYVQSYVGIGNARDHN